MLTAFPSSRSLLNPLELVSAEKLTQGSLSQGVAAIMACDFWIVRKGKLDIPELYKAGGRYWYW
jgi:hypothetical protein